MFCFCSGAFAKHSWVTGGFPMRWAGVTGRSDSVCLSIRLYMQSGSTFWQQTVMAHYFCFVLKEVNKQQTPTTSSKKRSPNSQRWSALLAAWSTPDWEMPHLLASRKRSPRRGSKGKREKWLPEEKAAGLAAGSQGTAEGQGSRWPYTVLHQQPNILPLKMVQATQMEFGMMSVPGAGIYISCEQNINLIYSFSPAGRRPGKK